MTYQKALLADSFDDAGALLETRLTPMLRTIILK